MFLHMLDKYLAQLDYPAVRPSRDALLLGHSTIRFRDFHPKLIADRVIILIQKRNRRIQ